MANKIKGIYLMTCSLGTANKNKHSQLAGQALRDLKASNTDFQKVHAQASIDRPRFHEAFQQIGYLGQPFDVIASNFKRWLQQQDVVINEQRWDQSFFYKEITEPTTVGVQKHYVLVYYHT
jgi:hypothetical protein